MPEALAFTCLLAAVPGGVVAAPFTMVLMAAFMTQVGALQTAPILIAVITAFLTMEGVKYLMASRKQAQAAAAKPQPRRSATAPQDHAPRRTCRAAGNRPKARRYLMTWDKHDGPFGKENFNHPERAVDYGRYLCMRIRAEVAPRRPRSSPGSPSPSFFGARFGPAKNAGSTHTWVPASPPSGGLAGTAGARSSS